MLVPRSAANSDAALQIRSKYRVLLKWKRVIREARKQERELEKEIIDDLGNLLGFPSVLAAEDLKEQIPLSPHLQ